MKTKCFSPQWLFAAFLTVLALVPSGTGYSQSIAPGTTIIVVRHAEKDTAQIDPELSAEGYERVKELTGMLASAKIAAIYSTQYKRTMNTVKPLSEKLGVPITVVPHDRSRTVREYSEGLAKKILGEQSGKTVLVSSHSNVAPEIIRALGISDPPTIDDSMYDDLFVVSKQSNGPASLLRLKYGKKSR